MYVPGASFNSADHMLPEPVGLATALATSASPESYMLNSTPSSPSGTTLFSKCFLMTSVPWAGAA